MMNIHSTSQIFPNSFWGQVLEVLNIRYRMLAVVDWSLDWSWRGEEAENEVVEVEVEEEEEEEEVGTPKIFLVTNK